MILLLIERTMYFLDLIIYAQMNSRHISNEKVALKKLNRHEKLIELDFFVSCYIK